MVRDFFNVKVYHYADKDQVRLYRRGIECQDNKRIDGDGVIHEIHKTLSQELNPFTGQYEHMRDFDDERSGCIYVLRGVNSPSFCLVSSWKCA